jgi:histidinol dehydrogenase
MIRIVAAEDSAAVWKRRAARMAEAEQVVRPILEAVRKRGDKAVMEYAKRFDGFDRGSLRVTADELAAARKAVQPGFRAAVKASAANVRAFAKLQLPRPFTRTLASGHRVGQVVRPLDSAACYIPGGRYPLPSTVIMTVVPAQAAGVGTVSVTTPKPVVEVLAAASMLNVEQVYVMGGAQAIAAFAFGTQTVPKADRIVGPGNIYVAAAKKLLAGEVGIDFLAGPTEILILADDGDPKWLAADLLAQAEHDTEASAFLLTSSRTLARRVADEVERQLATLPTAATARKAIDRNSAIVVCRSLEEAAELSNTVAPEHLSLYDPSLLPRIRHAGGIFLGPLSPEAAGDYAAGPSHVLPTGGVARIRGGLSSADFVKVIATQQLTGKALKRLVPAVATLARAEGLEAHARSVEVRFDE